MTAVVELARELIRRPSVTPEDAGCQALIGARLEALGFRLEPLRFGAVSNLWARRGEGGPLMCFAGHTDVVPTGPTDAWRHPPFAGRVEDGKLFGRGAADMKGSLAAMVCALERFYAAAPATELDVALLITSDEEGVAVDGTRRVIETLAARGEHIDWCLVGEPSSSKRVGDRVRIGRRGSLNARLTVRGQQGHVAFPELARNPVHDAAPALARLVRERWDAGNDAFPPTSLQVSNVAAGTGASNVIPGELTVDFNLRFSTELTVDDIRQRVEAILAAEGMDYRLEWQVSGLPFLSEAGPLTRAVNAAVREVAGSEPRPSTGGGTSDGRFIAPAGAEVVELGPVNATIHKIDECVAVAELRQLEDMYLGVVSRLAAVAAPPRAASSTTGRPSPAPRTR